MFRGRLRIKSAAAAITLRRDGVSVGAPGDCQMSTCIVPGVCGGRRPTETRTLEFAKDHEVVVDDGGREFVCSVVEVGSALWCAPCPAFAARIFLWSFELKSRVA